MTLNHDFDVNISYHFHICKYNNFILHFCIYLATKYTNFQEKIHADMSGMKLLIEDLLGYSTNHRERVSLRMQASSS